MATKDDVTVRIGSRDPVPFQLLSSGTAIDLTGVNYVDLLLKTDKAPLTATSFRSNTITSIFTITTASTGSLELRPASDTFSTEKSYFFYFVINDSAGKDLPVPENREYRWKVRFNY